MKRVYSFGGFSPDVNRYGVAEVHLIPLSSDYAGKILSLRFYSNIPGMIGPQVDSDPITIGDDRSVFESIVHRSLETTIIGATACLLGLVALLVSLRRFHGHKFFPLTLGVFSILIGLFFIMNAPLTSLVTTSLVTDYYLRFLSFILFPIALYIFIGQILVGSRVVRTLWIVHAIAATVFLLLNVAGIAHISSQGHLFNLLFTATILVMIVVGARAAFSGNREARILIRGVVVMGIAGLNDLLQGLGIMPFWHWIAPAGTLVFIGHLIYIVDHRFTQRTQLLKTYSQELEQKSAQLEEYAETLEQKVTARTHDLDAKNAELGNTLTELRDAQQQLVLREKMASLGTLVAGVAHEVNNPVGAINSAADGSNRCMTIINEFFNTHGSGDTKLQKAVRILGENNNIISTASQRVTDIVRSLRNFSRLDEAEFQKADLHEGLDSTLTLVHHQIKNRIEVIRDYGDIPAIECYPNQLNQVFMNILVNAGQAIEGKGTITIKTWQDDGNLFVRISDTGKGIPKEYVERLFDPGFTTKGVGVGTGLGLSISYKIVAQHGGDIKVESEPGKGATFTIRIPEETPKDPIEHPGM